MRDFKRRFKECCSSHINWNKLKFTFRNGDIWFTDGYRMSEDARTRIHQNRGTINESIPLDRYDTIFQVEVVAILKNT